MASPEEQELAAEALRKGAEYVKNQITGGKVDKVEQNRKVVEASSSAKSQVKASVEEIKAGITNDAAKAHVQKLSQEISSLRKESIKKDFMIRMLNETHENFHKEVASEIEEMRSYMVGVTGVFETFTQRIMETLKGNKTVLDGTNSKEESKSN